MPVLGKQSALVAKSHFAAPPRHLETVSVSIKVPLATRTTVRPAPVSANLSTWPHSPWMDRIKPGQTVVEIGSGTGSTCLALAERVGHRGRVVGIDPSPRHVEKARQAAGEQNLANVEFCLCRMDSIPLPDASADWVISNRQINLAANKLAVFREICRTLKPGGCLAVHDIAIKKLLPAEVTELMSEHLEGLAGAMEISTYDHFLRLAGFSQVMITDSRTELKLSRPSERRSTHPPQIQGNLYGGPTTELALCSEAGLAALRQYNLNDYAAVVDIFAIR